MEKEQIAFRKFAEKIQPVYELLKWTWHEEKVSPTVEQLTNLLIELLQDLRKNGGNDISTGGLFVKIDEHGIIDFGFEINNFIS